MGTNNKIFWTLIILFLLTSIYVQNVEALIEEKSLNDSDNGFGQYNSRRCFK